MEKNERLVDSKNEEFLNAYGIRGQENLSWDVAIYRINRLDGDESKNEDRGSIKDLVWDLLRQYKAECPGYGFILDLDETTVAIPKAWNIPGQDDFNGYRVIREDEFKAQMRNPDHRVIVTGILRESIKKHFKGNASSEIGPLWQDYGDFCQMPDLANPNQDIIYCRKFQVSAELLENNRWVLQIVISTQKH